MLRHRTLVYILASIIAWPVVTVVAFMVPLLPTSMFFGLMLMTFEIGDPEFLFTVLGISIFTFVVSPIVAVGWLNQQEWW